MHFKVIAASLVPACSKNMKVDRFVFSEYD